jgi:hypothetical protein
MDEELTGSNRSSLKTFQSLGSTFSLLNRNPRVQMNRNQLARNNTCYRNARRDIIVINRDPTCDALNFCCAER